jgi:hypothetical protein
MTYPCSVRFIRKSTISSFMCEFKIGLRVQVTCAGKNLDDDVAKVVGAMRMIDEAARVPNGGFGGSGGYFSCEATPLDSDSVSTHFSRILHYVMPQLTKKM